MVNTIKFSQMTDGGNLANDEKTPGLLGGANVLFNNPWTFLPSGTTADRPTPSSLINYRLRFNTTDQLYEYYDAVLGAWTQLQESAFTQGPFVIYTADPSIPDGQNLGALADGILKQTITLGVATVDIAVNGVDFYGPGYTGYLVAPAGIADIDGNFILTTTSVGASAVNSLRVVNSITGNPVLIESIGFDTNVGLSLITKGTGQLRLESGNATQPLIIVSGTLGNHFTRFAMADTSADRTATWQDSDGTIAWLSDVAGTVTSAQGTEFQVLVNGNFGTQETGACIFTLPQDIAAISSPTFNSLTLTNPLTVPNGGTGLATLTAYTLLAGGTTSTGNLQQVGAGAAGQLLQSAGAGALPTWTTSTFPSGSGTLNHMLRSDGTNWVETTSTTLDASDNFAGITSAAIGNLSLAVNTLSSSNSNGNIYLQPNGVGRTVVTNASAPSSAFLGDFGIVTVSASASQTTTTYSANSGQSSQLYLAKSHSTTPGSFSAIGSSEVIGQIFAYGDDGTQFTESCNIRFFVNGTVSSGIVPGQIQFLTANSSGAITQALAIDSAQQATFANNIIQSGFLRGTTEIQDSVANVLLDFATSGGTPFNYFQITNNPTGAGPNLNSLGGDTDVGMNFTTKGNGRFFWRSTHATPFVILNGTAYQRTNQFNFPDLSGNFAYTFPAATGTIALTADLTSYVTAVNGTANRITSTGGTTPTIDISASYVGQSSITTLGTIGTGVWNGTLVSPIYGGTGVNNGSNTLTLAGTLATSGAFSSVFTMTGATNVTFPTTGTLLTSAGAVTSITGTANQVIASASTGAVTLSLPQSIATSSSPTFVTVTGTTSVVAGATGSPANYIVSVAPGASAGNIVITAANSAGNFNGFITNASMSDTRTWTFPDRSGTVAIPVNGTFSPTIEFGGASVGVTYSSQIGKFQLVGNVATVQCFVTLSNKGSSVGNAAIGNLPYAPVDNSQSFPIGQVSNISFLGTSVGVTVTTAAVAVLYYNITASTPVVLTDTNFTNTSSVIVTFSYFIS
jgi:hypothetical protein